MRAPDAGERGMAGNEVRLCGITADAIDSIFLFVQFDGQVFEIYACNFGDPVVLCTSRQARDDKEKQNIRVWRSLVSRLNGVQEALSSNLNTRTKTPRNRKVSGSFYNLFWALSMSVYASSARLHTSYIQIQPCTGFSPRFPRTFSHQSAFSIHASI